MASFCFLKCRRWLAYHLFRPHRKGFGIHSPFVYRLTRDLFHKTRISNTYGSDLIRRLTTWYGMSASCALPPGPDASRPDGPVCYYNAAHTSVSRALQGFAPERCRTRDVIVLSGIYRSRDDYAAWQALLQDPHITASVDLYETGLVFFDERLSCQHFTVYAPHRLTQCPA